jgi:hypothetical protein
VGGAYWTGEQHLIKTARRWTILRMNYYAESMADDIPISLGMTAAHWLRRRARGVCLVGEHANSQGGRDRRSSRTW